MASPVGNSSEQARFVPDEAAVVDDGGERHKEHSKYETTGKCPWTNKGTDRKRRKSSETDHSGEEEQIN